jgi:hypothetical protein
MLNGFMAGAVPPQRQQQQDKFSGGFTDFIDTGLKTNTFGKDWK